jgi:hypothetical protein
MSGSPGGDLANADRAHHGKCRIKASRDQGVDLRDSSLIEHRGKTGIGADIKPVARWQQDQGGQPHGSVKATFGTALPFPDRDARRLDDFKCAGDALGVRGFQAARRGWVGFGKRRIGLIDRKRADACPYCGVDRRDWRNAVYQRPDVQP